MRQIAMLREMLEFNNRMISVIIMISLKDEKTTENLARVLAKLAFPGAVIFLKGELGTGKTTFVRYFLRGLGFSGSVKSPTYTLVEEYDFAWGAVYHFDLYRLSHPGELEFIGIQEYFTESALALVEWPERGKGVLRDPDLQLHFTMNEDQGGQARQVLIEAYSDRGRKLFEALTKIQE